MKILVFAHMSSAGGAQNALRRLVGLLKVSHDVRVVLSGIDSTEGRHYQSQGVRCIDFASPFALPNFSNICLTFAQTDWLAVVEVLRREKYDLVLSNTIAILHGAMTATRLGVPHVFYVHEFLQDPELLPTSIDRHQYLELVAESTSALIGCSPFVLEQFPTAADRPSLVLPPHRFAAATPERPPITEREPVVQVIGLQTFRKNPSFAVDVVKSLNVMGVPARLDIIGDPDAASGPLMQRLRKRKIRHRILTHQADPYALNAGAKVITLVCATSEPYGLTIPESMRLGIPVISSDCGGPGLLLPEELLYPVGDVDACVRRLIAVWSDYTRHCRLAQDQYRRLASQSPESQVRQSVDSLLEAAAKALPAPQTSLTRLVSRVAAAVELPLGEEALAAALDPAAASNHANVGAEDVVQSIANERREAGKAIRSDISLYDAIPFAMSRQMSALHRDGLGAAIASVAHARDTARLQLSSFIVCALWHHQSRVGRPLRILAVGDIVGIESLRLAKAGFSVDCIDEGGSRLSGLAARYIDLVRRNCQTPLHVDVIRRVETPYDALVCLDHIQLVSDPVSFAETLASYLEPGGLGVVSEAFNTVEDHWPNRLLCNERYSGLLPFLMSPFFDLREVNASPYGKPYVFERRPPGQHAGPLDLLLDRPTLLALIHQQLDIGT